jgi:hypothetical protein
MATTSQYIIWRAELAGKCSAYSERVKHMINKGRIKPEMNRKNKKNAPRGATVCAIACECARRFI